MLCPLHLQKKPEKNKLKMFSIKKKKWNIFSSDLLGIFNIKSTVLPIIKAQLEETLNCYYIYAANMISYI